MDQPAKRSWSENTNYMDTLNSETFPGYLWPIYTIWEKVTLIGVWPDDLPRRNLLYPGLESERSRIRRGQPGYIRIDTVHQGDINGHKGVYHINAVDEVTQWEIVASVERISEAYLVSILESMLVQFPFIIRGFHSDNGGEFVNHIVPGCWTNYWSVSPNRGPDILTIMAWWRLRMAQWCVKTWDMLISRKHMPNC